MSLEQQDYSRILETATVAARLAGQRAMEEMHYVKTHLKNGIELVTEADGRCQQIIVDRIKETFPDHGFIGEEGQDGAIFKRPPRGEPAIWWVIDPIDGTNNYARQIPAFAVSIGVLYEGYPIAGVIFDPSTDLLYTGLCGGEAQCNGRRIVTSQDAIGPLTSVGLDSHLGDVIPHWATEIMKQSRFRNFGTTALQLAYVATGGLVGTIVGTPKLWDIAAGVVIAEAAGAKVTDWKGQPLFPMDLETYAGGTIKVLVANTSTHAKLIELLNA